MYDEQTFENITYRTEQTPQLNILTYSFINQSINQSIINRKSGKFTLPIKFATSHSKSSKSEVMEKRHVQSNKIFNSSVWR